MQLTVFAVDNLKVLDRGLRDSSIKVEHIRRSVVVPDWSLVVQLYQVVHLPVLKAHQEAIVVLSTDAHNNMV